MDEARARPTRSIRLALLGLALWASSATARPVDEVFGPFAMLLERHVVAVDTGAGGRIAAFDYAGALEAGDTGSLLDRQDRLLAGFDRASLDERKRALAFWINAYNYFMIAHVLRQAGDDGELVDGVRDFGSFFNPFAVFRRERFDVGGRDYSLDGIEKGILFGDEFAERGWFDPRVHFAVNCASVGCPPLRDEPYRPARVDAQLDDNTRRSLATELHLRIEGKTVFWSSLFDWYEDDFKVGYDSVRDFVAAHVPPARARAVRAAERVRILDYDWALNRPAHFDALDR